MADPRNDLGYGDVDARPDNGPDDTHPDGEGPGGRAGLGPSGGGQSAGGARREPVETTAGGGEKGGQTDPAYRGPVNPNATRRGSGSDAEP